MKEVELNGSVIEHYDSIDDLPINRFHLFNKYALIDAGIGSDLSAIDKHLSGLTEMVHRNDTESAKTAIMNMRQNVHFMMQNINPKMMSFAVMVKSIDGVPCTDLSEVGLNKVIARLNDGGMNVGMLNKLWHSIKKKLRRRSNHTSQDSPMMWI